jgi:branched-chain amino acid transport system substrate-binding protein
MLSLVTASLLPAEKEKDRSRYANRPDSLVPYSRATIYKDAYAQPPEFKGAGREIPDPEVTSVKIGLIGPLTQADEPKVPAGFRPGVNPGPKALFGHHMLLGAQLAIDFANRNGGYQGKHFELVKRTDLVQWGQTSDELAKFAYEDRVWAVLSGMDSNHSHVLNRATLKAEVPLVNSGSTDPTLTEHNIPWLVRCINDDRLNSYELLNYIHRVRKFSRIAVLRVNDRDGRVGVSELIKGARRLGSPVLLELRFQNGDQDFRSQLEQIRALEPEVIVLWANPPEGALILKQARELGMTQQFVGFDRLSHSTFLEEVGTAGDGMVVAATFNPDSHSPEWVEFRRAYRDRYLEEPDTYAAHGFDGVSLIVAAVRQAGLNRARVRDALYALSRFPGVTGIIEFDPTMNDVSRPWLATVQNGRLDYFRPDDWPRSQRFPVVVSSAGSR